MSGIQDMNNRIKQNRNLRPSKRSKFKKNTRKTIYTASNKEDKSNLKEFSKFQVKKTIFKIRKNAKSNKRLDLILMIVFFGIFILFIAYSIITKEKPVKSNRINKSKSNSVYKEPIEWSGKLFEPLKVANSDYFYIPIVGNLDYLDLGRTYRVWDSNMVVKFTSNILFLDKDCEIIGKLLPENGSIRYMAIFPEIEEFKGNKIIYSLTQDEPNTYGKLYNIEKHYLYISDLDGKNLTKITDREVTSVKWDNKNEEILLTFFYGHRKNDSLYGVFNIESNKFRLASRLE